MYSSITICLFKDVIVTFIEKHLLCSQNDDNVSDELTSPIAIVTIEKKMRLYIIPSRVKYT